LVAYLSAPFWWIDDVPTAYQWVKALGAVLMATVVFPAYGLARLVVRPGWALFAAAGTGISPALAYAPILVKESTAYPAATLALFLIARWTARPTRFGLVLAVGGCVLGALAKSQLAVMFPILMLCALTVVWRTARMTAFRETWTRGDRIGLAVLAAGVVIVVNAEMSRRSFAWYVSTASFKNRMLELTTWAAGALAIGLGMVPLIAGLASLVPPKGEAPRPGVRAVATVTVASIACFAFYTAVKATYLSTVFATLTLERNLIFLGPLLLAGTALFLQRRGGRWWAVVAAGCVCLYLVRSTPYSLEAYPNYEAHGLAMAAFANRIFGWPAETIETVLVIATVVTTVALILLPYLRGRHVAIAVPGLLAAVALGWAGIAEIYAAHGESLFAKRLYGSLTKPANWVDQTTNGSSVAFLGQGIRDPNPINLLEFWNRSVKEIWSTDGTAPAPGATVTPDLFKPDGTITQPKTRYLLVPIGVDINGRRKGTPVGGYSLYPTRGGVRLRTAQSGIESDGWMGANATFSRYDVPPGTPGRVRIDLSREAWCGKDVRSVITIRLGPVGINESRQPEIAKVTQRESDVIHSCQKRTIELSTPPAPWRVEIEISPTFSPAALDPSQTDKRDLGARPTITFTDDR